MANIWFTSDLHFGHDREFVWKARGFNSVEEMNQAIVTRFNQKVDLNDTVYILGDIMLGDNNMGEHYLSQLNGKKIIILGNHDTNPRIEIYKKYAEEICLAKIVKYKKRMIYLSHYQTLTGNMDDTPGHCVLNFHGHTHQTENFTNDYVFMYHVGVDSHDCYPVHIDDALASIKEKRGKGEPLNEN